MNNATTTYRYNALGQRIHKANGSAATTFVYDETGHLLGEYTGSGALIQEIVWLNDIPVATIRTDQGGNSTGVFYIHTDHLNSPTSVTRSTNTNEVIWRWDHDAYGNGVPNEDPDSNGLTLSMNLRFPGQYLDQETGLYYNYFRYYDPSTGRYLESDPIGLDAGQFSTYAYVDGNPLSMYDSLGLLKINLLPKTDPNYEASEKYPDDPKVCLIISHGSNATVNHMNASQLNATLSALGCKPKQPVKLRACDTGKGENSIAEQLAKIRQSRVMAPTAKIWNHGDKSFETPAPPLSENHDSFLNGIPNWLQPGEWRTFGSKGPE